MAIHRSGARRPVGTGRHDPWARGLVDQPVVFALNACLRGIVKRLLVLWTGLSIATVLWAEDKPVLTWQPLPGSPSNNRVEVSGLGAEMWARLKSERDQGIEPERWLSVRVVPKDLLKALDVPAMGGRFDFAPEKAYLRFEPDYALEPGLRYEAVFRAGDLLPVRATLSIPNHREGPPTRVLSIYPSSEVLPENLLKFYLVFSGSMSRGHIYDFIELRDEWGKTVEIPFLEIDEELWDAAQTRLTLFIDPGRIKRGVKPLEEVGPAIKAGRRYSLRIDSKWPDAQGRPLAAPALKTFRVGPLDRTPIDPLTWRLATPRAGTRDPLVVRFGEPLDFGLAGRLLSIRRAGNAEIAGRAELHALESEWRWIPDQPWLAGRGVIWVPSILEDLAGNNVGKAFEVDVFEKVDRNSVPGRNEISFEIR